MHQPEICLPTDNPNFDFFPIPKKKKKALTLCIPLARDFCQLETATVMLLISYNELFLYTIHTNTALAPCELPDHDNV